MVSYRFLSISVMMGGALAVTCFVVYGLWKFRRRKQQNLIKLYTIHGAKIFIVNTPEEWDSVYTILMEDLSQIKVLGMDCEWVQQKRVALLQLASPSGICVLVRLFKLWPAVPASLKSVLADKRKDIVTLKEEAGSLLTVILKVGVAVTDDAKRLHHDYGLVANGCVDLRHVLRRIRGVFECKSKGLRGLSLGVLGIDISKESNVRCGNWEAEKYTTEQINYAATDALVAVDIFLQMVYTKFQMSKMPSNGNGLSHSKEILESNQRAINSTQVEFFGTSTNNSNCHKDKQQIVAIGNISQMGIARSPEVSCEGGITSATEEGKNVESFSYKHKASHSRKSFSQRHVEVFKYCNLVEGEKDDFWRTARSMCQGVTDVNCNFQEEGVHSFMPSKKPPKVKETTAYSTRKRPLWDNCRLEAPDGQPLCTCDTRKAQWYLDKELGTKICDNPLTVRLHFEPADRPESERNYYLQEKENMCVVCGQTEDYIRKFVIPFEYRKFFPSALKDHSSHDVLLLCVSCHRRSCDFDSALRLQLATECNAPVESGVSAKTVMNPELQKVRSAGRALKTNRQSIPEQRVAELEKVLQQFFGIDDVTDEFIDQASNIDARQTCDNYIPHAKQVVRYMARNGGLLAFQSRWRQHFLSTMNPQFLPAYWSVDFVPEAWKHSHAN